MALNVASTANFLLQLDRGPAVQISRAEIASVEIASIDPKTPAPLDPLTMMGKASGRLECGDCTIATHPSESQAQFEWLSSLGRNERIVKSGAIILADGSFNELGRTEFHDAVVKEMRLDDLDVSGGNRPYLMTYRFTPEKMESKKGSGARVQIDQPLQTRWSAARFRIKIGSLPCDRVTKVSGISIKAKSPTGFYSAHETYRETSIRPGDIAVEIRGDDEISEWSKFATAFLPEGVASKKDELDCVIEWLDPTLERTLASLTLIGCGLESFRLDRNSTHPESGVATGTATFWVERFDPEGIILTQ